MCSWPPCHFKYIRDLTLLMGVVFSALILATISRLLFDDVGPSLRVGLAALGCH